MTNALSVAIALCLCEMAYSLGGANSMSRAGGKLMPAQPRAALLHLRGGADDEPLPLPDTQRLKELGKCGGKVPYRRRCFNGDENPFLELAHGIFGFAKGIGAFFLISGVANVCYALAAGPKRTSPPPVRTTTGLPYQPGDAPTGK